MLYEISHVAHYETGNLVTVEAVAVKQSHYLDFALLALNNNEKVVLIWSVLEPFFGKEFY